MHKFAIGQVLREDEELRTTAAPRRLTPEDVRGIEAEGEEEEEE